MPFDWDALHKELTAEDGTFLIKVRGLEWDSAAFSRMEQLMREACLELQPEPRLERWMVEGFWYLSDWLPAWTSHPNFPRPEPASYYDRAIQRMRDLQCWFVMGESPYNASHVWEPL